MRINLAMLLRKSLRLKANDWEAEPSISQHGELKPNQIRNWAAPRELRDQQIADRGSVRKLHFSNALVGGVESQ